MAIPPVPSRYPLRHLSAFMVSVALTIIISAIVVMGAPHTLGTYLAFVSMPFLMGLCVKTYSMMTDARTYVCKYCDYFIVGGEDAICRGCVIDRYGIDPGENYNRFRELNPGKKP